MSSSSSFSSQMKRKELFSFIFFFISTKTHNLASTSWYKNKVGVEESVCVLHNRLRCIIHLSTHLSLSLSFWKLNPTSQSFHRLAHIAASKRDLHRDPLLSFSLSLSLSLSLSFLFFDTHKAEKFCDVELQSVWAEASCGTLLGDNVITFSQGQRDKC